MVEQGIWSSQAKKGDMKGRRQYDNFGGGGGGWWRRWEYIPKHI
jgi:hypothetical protein